MLGNTKHTDEWDTENVFILGNQGFLKQRASRCGKNTDNKMNIYPDDTNPETAIRSDLWQDMNLHELLNQQALVLNRINAVASMRSGGFAVESMAGMHAALQHASDVLTELINQATSNKKKKD